MDDVGSGLRPTVPSRFLKHTPEFLEQFFHDSHTPVRLLLANFPPSWRSLIHQYVYAIFSFLLAGILVGIVAPPCTRHLI